MGRATGLGILVAAVVAAAGCVTETAHRLPLVNNPAQAAAVACEADCRGFAIRAPRRCTSCQESPGERSHLQVRSAPQPEVSPPTLDEDAYARCLDTCPGVTAIDGVSCPNPPQPGVICVTTLKANPAGIAAGTAGTVAAGAVVLTVVLIVVGVGSLLYLAAAILSVT